LELDDTVKRTSWLSSNNRSQKFVSSVT